MPEASAIQYETGGLPPPQTPDIDPAARSFLSGVAGALNVGGNANANPNPNASGAGPAASSAQPSGNIKQTVSQLWSQAGYPAAAVDGITRRIGDESNWNPRHVGDDGTSFGLYQHHGPRAAALAQWSQANGLNPADPVTQTKFAIREMAGGDPTAARSRPALMNANDPNRAYGIFTASFERPAGAPGSAETNLSATAHGAFNGPAAALIRQWQAGMAQRSAEYDAALADAKDLHSASRAALAQWQAESDRPPQNMHETWSQFSGIAGVLVAFGSLFGRRNMTASLSAAGAMLQAANNADLQGYDKSYAQWKDHLDQGIKLISLLNSEARDVVDDARKSYDAKLAELSTLSSAYQLQQKLDPESVENQSKNLQLMKDRQALIVAQNTETEIRNAASEKDAQWLKDHPEATDGVPAAVHNANVGDARRERSGLTRGVTSQAIATQKFAEEHPNATAADWAQFNQTMRSMGRSGPAVFMQKFIEANPDATPEQIATASAGYAQKVSSARAFGAGGKAGLTLNSFNVVAQHLKVLNDAIDALDNGNVRVLNSVQQRFKAELGISAPVTFDFVKQLVGDEILKAVMGSGAGGVSDRQDIQTAFAKASSPAQLKSVVKAAVALIGGQVAGLKLTYNSLGMAEIEPFDDRLSPAARDALEQHDFKPVTPAAGVPSDLPSPAGYANGSVARDPRGRPVAKIVNGQWAAP